MTGRPEPPVRRHRVRLQGRRLGAGGLLLAAAALAGCDAADEAPPPTEVAVCTDLRARENALIQVANDALAALARADDGAARAAALTDGYDRLVEALSAQEPETVPDQPDLTERLEAGQRAAIAELRGERDRFVAEVRAVTQIDERGRAGELQNALEKAFSELEPPRSAYVAAGLDDDIDADPGCRHVTQRRDPAR